MEDLEKSGESEGSRLPSEGSPTEELQERAGTPVAKTAFDRRMLMAIAVLGVSALFFIFVVPFLHGGGGGGAVSGAKVPGLAALDSKFGAGTVESTEPTPPPEGPVAPREPAWRLSALASDPTIEIAESSIGKRNAVVAFTSTGISRTEAQRILDAFADVRSFDRVQPKHTFAVARTKGRSGRVVAFEYVESPTQIWQARANDAGVLEAKKLELVVDEHRVAVGFAVSSDLRDSVKKAGLDGSFLESLDDALDGHAELSDVRSGARLRVVATEERIDGAFQRYLAVGAVEYFPANLKADPIRVYYFADPRARGYYDAKGRRPYRGGFRSPLPGGRISSRFNPKRKHPVLKVVVPHNGVDFAAPPGTPVYATAAGSVLRVEGSGPCGNMVQVQHPGGLISAYCHLSRFASGLRAGQNVEARQLVGYVGQTGRATGPHLHFAIKRNGGFIDPLALKLDGVRVLPPSFRSEFEEARRKLDEELDGIAVPPPPAPPGAEALAAAAKAEDVEEVLDDMDPSAQP